MRVVLDGAAARDHAVAERGQARAAASGSHDRARDVRFGASIGGQARRWLMSIARPAAEMEPVSADAPDGRASPGPSAWPPPGSPRGVRWIAAMFDHRCHPPTPITRCIAPCGTPRPGERPEDEGPEDGRRGVCRHAVGAATLPPCPSPSRPARLRPSARHRRRRSILRGGEAPCGALRRHRPRRWMRPAAGHPTQIPGFSWRPRKDGP